MARIAHLSDIHFGANDPFIVAATENWLQEKQPDLVIISGDLTQRAKVSQFREASGYLGRIRDAGFPTLVIPGNHDVPLYNVFRRFVAPMTRYKRYIDENLCPWFENDEVAVLGINTARSLTIKDGRINSEQLAMLRDRFGAVAPAKTRILVTHHPLFAMPIGEGGELSEAVGRHRDAIAAVAEAGVHIALAGHFHRTYAEAALKWSKALGRFSSCRPERLHRPGFATRNCKALTGYTRTVMTRLNCRSSRGMAVSSNPEAMKSLLMTGRSGLRGRSQRVWEILNEEDRHITTSVESTSKTGCADRQRDEPERRRCL